MLFFEYYLGVEDCTKALNDVCQFRFNHEHPKGAVLYFPKGTYLFRRPPIAQHYCAIYGDKNSTAIFAVMGDLGSRYESVSTIRVEYPLPGLNNFFAVSTPATVTTEIFNLNFDSASNNLISFTSGYNYLYNTWFTINNITHASKDSYVVLVQNIAKNSCFFTNVSSEHPTGSFLKILMGNVAIDNSVFGWIYDNSSIPAIGISLGARSAISSLTRTYFVRLDTGILMMRTESNYIQGEKNHFSDMRQYAINANPDSGNERVFLHDNLCFGKQSKFNFICSNDPTICNLQNNKGCFEKEEVTEY